MIVLALLCLVLAAAAIVFMLSYGTDQTLKYSFFAGDFETRPIWIFVAGAVTLLLIVAALEFFRRGTRRKVAQRREIKRLRKVEQTTGAPMASSGSVSGGSVSSTGATGASDATHGHAHEETLVREVRHDGPNDRV